jgi:hypothetical protein
MPPPAPSGSSSNRSWKDLVELARDATVSPAVRRHAEQMLEARLPALAVGERVALARRASRGLIRTLCDSLEPRVLLALLDNPYLRESEIERFAGADTTPAATLDAIARHARWSARRSVLLALVSNPRTPVPTALRLLAELRSSDLHGLANDVKVPAIVRVAAERRYSTSPRVGAPSAARGPGWR